MLISGGAVITIQAALLQLSEYITNNITVQNVDSQQNILMAIRQTLVNLYSIIDAYSIQVVANKEYNTLIAINNSFLNVPQQDLPFISNRLAAFQFLVNTVYPLPVWVDFEIDNISLGLPAVQPYDLVSYMVEFDAEDVPIGLNNTNLTVVANQAATSWLDVLNFISMNGTPSQLSAYDAVNRMYQSSQDTANLVANLSLSPAFQSVFNSTNLFGSNTFATLNGLLPTQVTNGGLQFVGGGYGSLFWSNIAITGDESLEFQINNGGVLGFNSNIPNLLYEVIGNEVFTVWVQVLDNLPDEIVIQIFGNGQWRSVYWGTSENFAQYTSINPIFKGIIPNQTGQWIGLTFTIQDLGLSPGSLITGIGWGVYKNLTISSVLFSDLDVSTQTPTANFQPIWNSIVALPSMLRVASLLTNDPSSLIWQQTNAIRFLIYLALFQTNTLLASFGVPNTTATPVISQLRVNETLLDFAARTLGDVTQWTTIAAINNLRPPYVGTSPAPGIATPGAKLYLPPGPTASSPISDYNTTYLGTDIYLGPLLSPLITWTGDFATVSGIDNYTYALARRVLTSLGNLIYHTTYGSKLPGEIGNINTVGEAGLLAGYLKSALQSDPRTRTVNKVISIPISQDQVALLASVTPYGGPNPTNFNLILVRQTPGINASQIQAS